MTFFDLKFTGDFCLLSTPAIFYPPEVDHPLVVPYGVPLWSLSVLYQTLEHVFWISICWRYLLIFDLCIFLSPGGGPLWSPYGVPIWSLSVLYLPRDKNFWGQKWADTASKLNSKKVFLGVDIREKEIKLGPHRCTTKDGPPSGEEVGSGLGPRRAGVTVQHGDAFQTFFSFSSLILCPSFFFFLFFSFSTKHF